MNTEWQSSLLESLAAGSTPDVHDLKQTLLAQLSQQAQENPRIALLTHYLLHGKTQSPRRKGDVTAHERATTQQVDPEMVEQRREALRALREGLRVLQARNDHLARALGACRRCWGTDAECPDCDGIGRPGWAYPDQASFIEWVTPALHRLNRQPSARPHPVWADDLRQRTSHNLTEGDYDGDRL